MKRLEQPTSLPHNSSAAEDLTEGMTAYVVSWEYGNPSGDVWQASDIFLGATFEEVMAYAEYVCAISCLEAFGIEDISWWDIVKVEKMGDGPLWICAPQPQPAE